MKREIEKFPYGTGSGLSEAEAKENFVNFCKDYGPLTLRIGLFALMMSSTAFAADTPPSGPAGNQCAPTQSPTNSPNVLPATKELVGIAAVGLVCAAAAANPVTAMGIAACLLTIAAKACNKL
jgi:hypothetical protein